MSKDDKSTESRRCQRIATLDQDFKNNVSINAGLEGDSVTIFFDISLKRCIDSKFELRGGGLRANKPVSQSHT